MADVQSDELERVTAWLVHDWDVSLEQTHTTVEGVGQFQFLHQQLHGPQACAAQSLGLVSDLEVDVPVAEHGLTLHLPLALAKPPLNPALAITEPLLYLGFHLKYLRAVGMDERVATLISPQMPRYFKVFLHQRRQTVGETLVLGLAGPSSPSPDRNLRGRSCPRPIRVALRAARGPRTPAGATASSGVQGPRATGLREGDAAARLYLLSCEKGSRMSDDVPITRLLRVGRLVASQAG